MNQTPKYIVFESSPMPIMVIFPACVEHDSIKRRIQLNPLGAGFIENGICFGESVSLGIGAREDDQALYDVFFKGALDGK